MRSKSWKPRWMGCARPGWSLPRSSCGWNNELTTAAGGILQDVGMPGRELHTKGLVRRVRRHVRKWAPHRMVPAIILGIAIASFGLPLLLPPLRLAEESFGDLLIG